MIKKILVSILFCISLVVYSAIDAKTTPTVKITSFTASPTSIASGSISKLSFVTIGATKVTITPGTYSTTSASGSLIVTPTATTTYTLTASNGAQSVKATASVTVTSSGGGSGGGTLAMTTTSCPAATQGTAYAGCTLVATGGTPPYTFSVSSNTSYPPLPEGLNLNASTGAITSSQVGGQGTYIPLLVVTDSAKNTASHAITFAVTGNNSFLTTIFPSNSIFHHRVDAATTGLPVDTSPAAAIPSSSLNATLHPVMGTQYLNFPNGTVPAISVPYNTSYVNVTTTIYQSYFTSGPFTSYTPVEGTSRDTGDRHVSVYLQAGPSTPPSLWEMWQGIYNGGSWTDSSNAYWPDVTSNALLPQGKGSSDAAGLPVSPLEVNADEVIGTGTPSSPNGVITHPIRFTLNQMLQYWVWPATATAGGGTCTNSVGSTIPTYSMLSQSDPPTGCTQTGPSGQIYRLKANVQTPACAATSPQAAIIITAFRNYGIILADNGSSGFYSGTSDARWNDSDLACTRSLTLANFEPVNVSSLMINTTSGQTSH